MAGAHERLPRATSVDTDNTERTGASTYNDTPSRGSTQGLALYHNTNLFSVFSASALLAPVDRGRPIPSLSTAPPQKPVEDPPVPADAESPLEQFHSAMDYPSMLPPPFGAPFSVIDGGVYGLEMLADLVRGDFGEAGLDLLGAGTGIAGVAGPGGRAPAKFVHKTIKQVARLRRLALNANGEHRLAVIRQLGDVIEHNGPGASIAVSTLETIALRRSAHKLQPGIEDYISHVCDAASKLVRADTEATNQALRRILVDSRGNEVRFKIINEAVNYSQHGAQLLEYCVVNCPDTLAQSYAIDALFTRSLDHDDARPALRDLLRKGAPRHRRRILEIAGQGFPGEEHLLGQGLSKGQPDDVRVAAASGMAKALHRVPGEPIDSKRSQGMLTALKAFRAEIVERMSTSEIKSSEQAAADRAFAAVVLEIDHAIAITPH